MKKLRTKDYKLQTSAPRRLALLCGGPSLERGISLNSARSVMDHLQADDIEIIPIYFDHQKNPYHISPAQLYSNTPSDFDFKLHQTAKKLSANKLKSLLKSVDLAFPVMHGQFGEDGTIQRLLERHNVPYLGSPVEACKRCFDKYEANEFIRNHGFYAPPSVVLKIFHNDHKKILNAFFKENKIKRAVVKPATGGSSIGVFSVSNAKEALKKAQILFSKRMDTRVVVEPFCEGIEFTVILLQNRFGMPVAILPTEIETDYQNHQLFDFRKKYLPTRQVRYHCPPRFSNEIVEKIQVQAEQLFTLLGMRDFARFDGWLLPDGKLWFSDFNPISGMEQNSFLFQQSARIGMSHRDLLRFLVKNACHRTGIPFPLRTTDYRLSPAPPPPLKTKNHQLQTPVNVLFGGATSERQVSLMSGTNVWLKLRSSPQYDAKPFLLDLDHNVWQLPYALTLNHTVDEIADNCHNAQRDEKRLHQLVEKVRLRLALDPDEANAPFFIPKKISLAEFLKESRRQNAFIFIGLHGGMGEDGTLQKMLTDKGLKFNGPREKASRLCMDKYATICALKGLETKGIFTPQQSTHSLNDLTKLKTSSALNAFFKKIQKKVDCRRLIVKPLGDGCSSGVACLNSAQDLKNYLYYAAHNAPTIPPHTFKNQLGPIEMPLQKINTLLFENFIKTDAIRIKGNRLKWKRKNGWIEVTVGVLQEKATSKNHKKTHLKALSPSLTVASGQVLSVEEKFQGGTGINITPPSANIVKPKALEKAKKSIELIAKILKLEGYSRIDTFLHVDTGDLIVIEVNTTPALTPSTVLFHQALAENPPIYPRELIEKLIENKQ